MKTIQQAVTDYVSENNITKDALIEELGFGRSAFFMKMRGETELTISEAYRLSRKLGCTMDELYAMTKAV